MLSLKPHPCRAVLKWRKSHYRQRTHRPQCGFSLPELLVAMLGSTLVLAAGLGLLVSMLVVNNTHTQLSRLDQELHGLSDMLSRDIQLAGYHPLAAKERALNQAPLAQQLTFNPQQDMYPNTEQAHCIRLKFWDPDAHAGERLRVRIYHFHASSATVKLHQLNNEVSTELSDLCHLGQQLVASQEVRITHLAFRLSANSQFNGTRSLEFAVAGAIIGRAELAYDLQRRVLLRNQASL